MEYVKLLECITVQLSCVELCENHIAFTWETDFTITLDVFVGVTFIDSRKHGCFL